MLSDRPQLEKGDRNRHHFAQPHPRLTQTTNAEVQITRVSPTISATDAPMNRRLARLQLFTKFSLLLAMMNIEQSRFHS